ncbi:hypothetical protein UY3_10976 [Chelonia mydas]|uniref:Uncharacterized protein n=1 Tax=Chelonia mydas TaxID=8469 RepID=M7BIM2_CHEMY|nr:hypothetical protein UY3_10976 [Chelonia mydas]
MHSESICTPSLTLHRSKLLMDPIPIEWEQPWPLERLRATGERTDVRRQLRQLGIQKSYDSGNSPMTRNIPLKPYISGQKSCTIPLLWINWAQPPALSIENGLNNKECAGKCQGPVEHRSVNENEAQLVCDTLKSHYHKLQYVGLRKQGQGEKII